MRLGVFSTGTKDAFEAATQAGLSFVDITIPPDTEPEQFMERIPDIMAMSEEAGIPVGSILWHGRDKLDGDGSVSERELAHTTLLIDACALIGCPVLSLGCNYVHEVSLLRNIQNASRFLDLSAKYAAEKQIKLSVHNQSHGNFIYSDSLWDPILGDNPELYITYNPAYALQRRQDYLSQAFRWGHRFSHVRLTGAMCIGERVLSDAGLPVGLDGIAWRSFIGCLRLCGYDGGLAVSLPDSPAAQAELDFTVGYLQPMLRLDI